MSAPGWLHPTRSDPSLATGLGPISHIGAVVIALVLTVLAGYGLALLGSLFTPNGQGVLAAIGLILTFSVLFSWVGHIPGAALLHVLIQRGQAGWAVAMAAGLAVGAVCAMFMGTPLPLVVGPFLALFHLVGLRGLAGLMQNRTAR